MSATGECYGESFGEGCLIHSKPDRLYPDAADTLRPTGRPTLYQLQKDREVKDENAQEFVDSVCYTHQRQDCVRSVHPGIDGCGRRRAEWVRRRRQLACETGGMI